MKLKIIDIVNFIRISIILYTMNYILQLDNESNEKIIRTLHPDDNFVGIVKELVSEFTDTIILENLSLIDFSSNNNYKVGLYLLTTTKQIILVHKLNQQNITTIFTWKLLTGAHNESDIESFAKLYRHVRIIKSIKNTNDKSLSDDDILGSLSKLWTIASGNKFIKNYIGTNIADELTYLLHDINIKIVICTAKLLRSITVHRNNKIIFQSYCPDMINVLKITISDDVYIPLIATIWNLSSLKANRRALITNSILDILDKILCQNQEKEVQLETCGLIRNLTLDETSIELFAKTNIINNLMSILKTTETGDHLTCILNSIRNLSMKTINHEKIINNNGICILATRIIITNNTDDQRYISEIFINLSKNENIQHFLDQQELLPRIFYELISKLKTINNPNRQEYVWERFVKFLKQQ